MFKRILVAVDRSPTALHGLKAAVELAADQRATLIVLHVIDEFGVTHPGVSMAHAYVKGYVNAVREAGKEILAKAESLLRRRGGVDYETLLVDSGGENVARAILSQARLLRADIIVLGTHGRRGLRRALLGSDAEAVLRESRVPVLLVRSAPGAKHAARSRAGKPAVKPSGAGRKRMAPALRIESSQ